MLFVKSLVFLAPALVAFVACDTNASAPADLATVTSASMSFDADLTAKRECTVARRNVLPQIDAATFAANRCEVDADCAVATSDTMCFGTTHHAVSFAGMNAFMMRVAKADARFCASVPDSCGASDDTSATTAVCSAGRCELRAAKVSCLAGEVATSEGCLAPELARAKAEHALDVAVDAAASCTSDAECIAVMDMTGCASPCGVAINPKDAGPFTERMTEILGDYCTSDIGVDVACHAAVPTCVASRCELTMP